MKIIKFIVLLFFTTFIFTACSSSNSNKEDVYSKYFSNYQMESNINSTIDIKPSETKLYYAENKYVSFSITDEFKVSFKENDIILFDDGTAMAKLYSNVSLSLKDVNFKLIHNNYYINYQEKKIITKISTGSKSYSLSDINFNNFHIVNASIISCVYENFEFVGSLIYYQLKNSVIQPANSIDISFSNNEFKSSTGTVYYAYINNDIDFKNIKNNIVYSNIEHNISLYTDSNENKYINFQFDCIVENENFYTYSIIKDKNNKFYFINLSLNGNNIYSINEISNFKINYTTISFF